MAGSAQALRVCLVVYTFLLKRGEYLWEEASVSTAAQRVCWWQREVR